MSYRGQIVRRDIMMKLECDINSLLLKCNADGWLFTGDMANFLKKREGLVFLSGGVANIISEEIE